MHDHVNIRPDFGQFDRLDDAVLADAGAQLLQAFEGKRAARLLGIGLDGVKAHSNQLKT